MFLLSLVASIAVGAIAVENSVVTLRDGTELHGGTKEQVVFFKGIPYAAPPVGALRWAPPAPWVNPNINNPLDVTIFGNECKQLVHGEGTTSTGNEDCLFLNVYSPQNFSVNSNLPVALYIHGGSYTWGSGNDYDGTDFINFWDGKAVVVSINYRLHVFGFAGSDALRSQDVASKSTGNYGVQDQRMAMRWVQDNIEAFGGNKNDVMIYGESAGAGSISNHLAMRNSWGLFASATLESGSFSEWVTQPMNLAQDAYERLSDANDCSPEDLQCLLNKSEDELFTASLTLASIDPSWGSPWNPTVDGVELLTHPWIALASGAVADVEVMHGTNRDEGSMFYDLPNDLTQVGLVAYWKSFDVYTDFQIDELLVLYTVDKEYPLVDVTPQPSLYWWAGMRWLGDLSFSCPARYTAKQFSRLQTEHVRKSASFMYHFEYHADSSPVPYVQHTAEIPFVFHMHNFVNSTGDYDVANVMSTYWGNFLSSHNPNNLENAHLLGDRSKLAQAKIMSPVQVPQWPWYSGNLDDLQDIVSGDDIFVESGLKKKECDFHIRFINTDIYMKFPH